MPSPQDTAAAFLAEWVDACPGMIAALAALLAAERRGAAEAMRGRCATLARDYNDVYNVGFCIASDIRALPLD